MILEIYTTRELEKEIIRLWKEYDSWINCTEMQNLIENEINAIQNELYKRSITK